MNLSGLVLDFGGGRKTNYTSETVNWGGRDSFEYESANIDPNTKPHYLIEEGGYIPVEDERFDAVVSLNTFEHIYQLDIAFSEISRTLKRGGDFFFIVPFVFRVHGHPDDYNRGTPSFWQRKLAEFDMHCYEIKALFWGPFSTATTVSGLPGPLKGPRRTVAFFADLIYARLKWGGRTELLVDQDNSSVNSPIGYLVRARKQAGPVQ